MTTEVFNEESKRRLRGKTIVDVGENYIVLDSGVRIYIMEDSEIEHINDMFSND